MTEDGAAALALDRFAENHQEMRRVSVILPTSALYAALACLPLIPGVRESTPAPFRATFIWGACAIAAAWLALFAAKKWNVRSRAYRRVDDLESVVVAVGAAVLVGVGGRATSIWWLMYFAACVYMASIGGRRRFNAGVISAAAILASVLLAWCGGRQQALVGVLVGGMGIIAWWAIATSSDRVLDVRAERDALAIRVRDFEAERERRHLVRELHDGVGSALSLAALYGDIIQRGESTSDELALLAAGLSQSAKEGLHDLRAALHAIAPPSSAPLSPTAMATAMRVTAARLEGAAGVKVSVGVSAETERVLGGTDASLRLTFVRVFQEAARNAVRHGGAKQIDATLAIVDAALLLSVTDDGSGIPSETSEGRGLIGMRQRAAELGGSAVFERAPIGQGTVVQFSVPLPGRRSALA
jgi:signal transduction histidine kinase